MLSMSDAANRAQVSIEGGSDPQWARSGSELLFTSKNRIMSAKFSPGIGLNLGKPTVLFEDKRGWTGYDIAADGRLVVARNADDKGTGTQINIVLNWFEELKKR